MTLPELIAAHRARTIAWPAFVAAVERMTTFEGYGRVREAVGNELFWQVVEYVVRSDPNHWMRGFGDGDAARDLFAIADEEL